MLFSLLPARGEKVAGGRMRGSFMSFVPSMQIGLRAGAALVDGVAGAETVEPVGGGELVGLAGGDQMGEAPARRRGGLEAAIAPAAIEIEVVDRRLVDDRRTIHGHVHDAAPGAQDADA